MGSQRLHNHGSGCLKGVILHNYLFLIYISQPPAAAALVHF
jgi:hypothetical protein